MVTLHILRHGKAKNSPGLTDIERPLAERGRQDSARMGGLLAKSVAPPTLILCSSAQRARETLAGVLPQLTGTYRIEVEERLYTFDPEPIIKRLKRISVEEPSVLLVGHNPALEQLTTMLSASGSTAAFHQLSTKFPTCAFATIEFTFDNWGLLSPEAGRLTHLTIPADLD